MNLKLQTSTNYVVVQEYIKLGQRIKSLKVDALHGDHWHAVAEAPTVGYKRILPTNGVKTNKLRIQINDSKACPVLSNIEIY